MLGLFDIWVSLLYLFLIYIIAVQIKKRKIIKIPLYKWFIPGLMVRIFGGIMVCLIYVYYYEGGDTTNYFKGSVCLINLMFKNFPAYLDIMTGNLSYENYLSFDQHTGYPPTYMYKDEKTFAVIRYVNPLVILSMMKFLPTTILLATLAYSGPWRLFLVFCSEFPGLSKQLAYAILFVPSVFFWGSGLLKDTFTFSAICWYTFSFYKIFIVKEKRIANSVYIVIALWVLISIKPYLFIAIFPGSILWFIFTKVNKVKSALLRVVYFPVVTAAGLIIAFSFVSVLGSQLGKYRLDNLMDMALITQDDLSRDTYGPNSFDIGELDGTVSNMLSKSPIAVSATLFRPFIWEIRNPVMLLSALENSIVLVITLLMLITIKPLVIVRIIFSQPILLFSLTFSIILAFSIGVSTANFGALVRYKIPLMPYFISSILVIQYFYKFGEQEEIKKELSPI